jgi:hypothetical protein
MNRIDYCSAHDTEAQQRLLFALARLGARWEEADREADDFPLGVTRCWVLGHEITFYRDCYLLDLAGPEEIVTRLLRELSNPLN